MEIIDLSDTGYQTLESLSNKIDKNEMEWRNLKQQYNKLWIEKKYGKYINQFTKCELSNDGMPFSTKYLYIKNISRSSKYDSYIVITGIGFDIQQSVEWETRKILDTKFNFNNHFQIHIDIDDAKIDIISEDEWRKELKKEIRLLNNYVKNDLNLNTY